MSKFIENCFEGDSLRSSLVSRNITILGRRTSVRLEPEMWLALRDISKREKCTIHDICTIVFIRKQKNTSLTAAIRVFLMLYFRAASTEEGHIFAGHGDFETMKKRARISEDMDKYFKKAINSNRYSGVVPGQQYQYIDNARVSAA